MIIMYTKTGCPWCNGAREYMSSINLDFEEREVTGNSDFMKELEEKSGQTKTPTLDVDGEILADVDKDEIATFLKEKGII